MKMPRSNIENENVQFVQELAEVDGPFESPIDINFRDLTKLELPSLCWNRGESSPKKMKITNTGHTVIISGKWKSERPYLTGGPLVGKYVFSQIHFHWGQDDCKGSEHQICGEGFPLEMHVAHFKTDYVTQESALREKDGMVVVVYLFKIQDEPNVGLKKILSALPCVQQASTSQQLDPRPILSLCNPFKDDYFLYWGSVVTSTCAHILMWMVCREPFGISREQVSEFRKILDPSQTPISRNSRSTQPLHSRNVFHVNASKFLDEPLLPCKQMAGCFCRKSEENVKVESSTNECLCQAKIPIQEDIEDNNVNFSIATLCRINEDDDWTENQPTNFLMRQSFYVQRATVHSVPLLSKGLGSDYSKLYCSDGIQFRSKSKTKLASQSCCFLPVKEVHRIKTRAEKRKPREKKNSFNSLRAISHIMNSLETLKNHTFKKLKEIESINQEIKGMKYFCQDVEEKKWLRKIEKIMSRQKRFTLKSSQTCFSELKKLARECNFDKFFVSKVLPEGDNNQKVIWLKASEVTDRTMNCSDVYMKDETDIPVLDEAQLKSLNVGNTLKFSTEAQKLIQSFFEDIKETDDLQESVEKNLHLKNLKPNQAGDSTAVTGLTKGYITQKMFTLGNLGDRFFTEVTPEDVEMNENNWKEKERLSEFVIPLEETKTDDTIELFNYETKLKDLATIAETKNETDLLPKSNASVNLSASKQIKPNGSSNKITNNIINEENLVPRLNIESDTESTAESEKVSKTKKLKKKCYKKSIKNSIKNKHADLKTEKFLKRLNASDNLLCNLQDSSSNLSTDSIETQRMIVGRLSKRNSRKGMLERKPSLTTKVSLKELSDKKSYKKHKLKNINFEGYYIQRKKIKNKKKKNHELLKGRNSSCDGSSVRENEIKELKKSKWKRLTKAKFKLEIEKTSDSTMESTLEYYLLSPKRKKLKLERNKTRSNNSKIKAVLDDSKQIVLTDSDAKIAEVIPQREASKPTVKIQETVGVQTPKIINEGEGTGKSEDKTKINVSTEKIQSLSDRSQTFQKNSHVSRKSLKTTPRKTLRPSSADSKVRSAKHQDSLRRKKGESSDIVKTELFKKDSPKFSGNKLPSKNKSLTNLTSRFKSTDISQRVFVENLDDRRKSAREHSQFIKNLESTKVSEENSDLTTEENLSQRHSNKKPPKNLEKEKEQTSSNQNNQEKDENVDRKTQEFDVGFFTTTSSQIDEELISKIAAKEEKSKSSVRKSSDAEKGYLSEKELKTETSPKAQSDEQQEGIQRRDSSKGGGGESSGPDMKGDAHPSKAEEKDLQPSISYLFNQKTTSSRTHSAESIVSPVKPFKRKSKMRPHCSKRSSKLHIRKNPSLVRKPNKIESKPQHSINLMDDEQLKIISVNVAKYLKEKLVEQNKDFDPDNKCSFKKIEELVLENLKASEEKTPHKNSTENTEKDMKETDLQSEEVCLFSKTNEKRKKSEKSVKAESFRTEKSRGAEHSDSSKDRSKVPSIPRPVHNFIKLNKQLAGKYKRSSSVTDKESNKNEKTRKKSLIPKIKPLKKKKEKISYVENSELQFQQTENADPRKNSKQEKVNKSLKSTRSKTRDTSKEYNLEAENEPQTVEKAEEEAEMEESTTKNPSSSMVLQKLPLMRKCCVPAYILTSYLPPPIEIIENQQRHISKYLLNKQKTTAENLPEVLYEVKGIKKIENESTTNKDAEYLIKLHIGLNNDVSTNVENSMNNYMKTLLSQEYASAIVEKVPVNETLELYDPFNNGVVLINLPDGSSPNSDQVEDLGKSQLLNTTTETSSVHQLKTKEISTIKIPQESGELKVITPPTIQEIQEIDRQEEYSSDSSYNCEISITLNVTTSDKEYEMQVNDSISCLEEISSNYNYTCDLGAESNVSQTSAYSEEGNSSQSIIVTKHRKKRKENEISVEMKQKLLEILEGEIKREMGFFSGVSSEHSSDGFTVRWEDSSDAVNKSRSTDSSCENPEVLAQISETMRQYLSEFKERRKLSENLNKDNKGEDVS